MDNPADQGPAEGSQLDELVAAALDALARPGVTILEAQASVPAVPGLYAVHGEAEV